MHSHERIVLKRECEAVQIPSGYPLTLPAGTEVMITQSLGGTYTVTTDQGYLARIAGKDADALGIEATTAPVESTAAAAAQTPDEVEKLVWDQMRTCYDPEIPVNIVDLGLVYSCSVVPRDTGGYRTDVKFTLTAPGCGMGDWLRQDLLQKLGTVPGVEEVDVEVVFDPPWNQSMMSEAAKLELGMM